LTSSVGDGYRATAYDDARMTRVSCVCLVRPFAVPTGIHLPVIGAHMNRLLVAACFVGILGGNAVACAVTGVGDPCIPEQEFSEKSGSAQPTDLTIDVNSVQCDTRVCLSHYFKGRVSCPYGNNGQIGQNKAGVKCIAVKKGNDLVRDFYTLDGSIGGTPCCPVLGDIHQAPIGKPVDGQCSLRPAKDAVYCSCRCAVPDDKDIDKSLVNLCTCPDGYQCKPLCDSTNGNCSAIPKGKWGSYCVKAGKNGYDFDEGKDQITKCGEPLPFPG
jgi:hypothetical protein